MAPTSLRAIAARQALPDAPSAAPALAANASAPASPPSRWSPASWRLALSKVDGRALAQTLALPLLGLTAFVILWAVLAPRIHTSLGALPGPGDVLRQALVLWGEHLGVQNEKAAQAASGVLKKS